MLLIFLPVNWMVVPSAKVSVLSRSLSIDLHTSGNQCQRHCGSNLPLAHLSSQLLKWYLSSKLSNLLSVVHSSSTLKKAYFISAFQSFTPYAFWGFKNHYPLLYIIHTHTHISAPPFWVRTEGTFYSFLKSSTNFQTHIF